MAGRVATLFEHFIADLQRRLPGIEIGRFHVAKLSPNIVNAIISGRHEMKKETRHCFILSTQAIEGRSQRARNGCVALVDQGATEVTAARLTGGATSREYSLSETP